MKNVVLLLLGFVYFTTVGQNTTANVNKKGFIAEGYDVVAYFKTHKAIEGNKKYLATYNGAKYQFSSEENRVLFLKTPEKYVPQYGGWCAYALGTTGEKVKINPKTFEIRDEKLYLFYNAWGVNTLKKWLDEDPKALQKNADINWSKITE